MHQLTMGPSWRAGRVFGIPISLNWSLGLIVAFDVVRSMVSVPFPYSLAAIGIGLLILASILFHELAHASIGRKYGYHTSAIELHAFGGFAVIHGHIRDQHQLKISAAGPFSNLLLWLVFNGIAQVAGPGVIAWVAVSVAHTNLWLGLFNLLPAYPLDGGSMLLSWLSLRAPEAQARWLAFTIGRWLSAPLGILGLLTNNLLMSLIFYTAYMASTAMLESVGHVGGWQYWKARWTRPKRPTELKVDWQKYSPRSRDPEDPPPPPTIN